MNNLACPQTVMIGSSGSRIQTQMGMICREPIHTSTYNNNRTTLLCKIEIEQSSDKYLQIFRYTNFFKYEISNQSSLNKNSPQTSQPQVSYIVSHQRSQQPKPKFIYQAWPDLEGTLTSQRHFKE